MTVQEYDAWWQYYLEEPFGYVHDQKQSAILRATIINYSGKVVETPVNPIELMPDRFQSKDHGVQDPDAEVIQWLSI